MAVMTKDPKLIDLRFPAGGLVKRYAYQNQPPYTSPDCCNVIPFDTFEGRERGGSRPGLVKSAGEQLGAPGPVQMLCPISAVTPAGLIQNTLVAAAGGIVYYRTIGGVLTAIAGTVNATAPLLTASQLYQKLYLADFRATRIKGEDGVITATNKLSCASVPDWRTQSIDTALDVCFIMTPPYSTGTITIVAGVVTLLGGTWPTWAAGCTLTVRGLDHTVNTRDSNTQLTLADLSVACEAHTSYSLGSPAQDDIYPIASVAADGTYITLTATLTDGTPRTYEIGRKIKVFDPVTNTMASLVASYGIPPVNCPLVCTYRERLVLAGPDHVWYMSRQGDATDWDYGADPSDVARPVPGTTEGDPIRALIPHYADYLVIACENSIWVLHGDPASGGRMDALTRDVGIVGPGAWCTMPDGSILLLSRQGLILIPPGADASPIFVSRDLLPVDLIDVDAVTNAMSMMYDSRGSGVHLYITPIAGTAGAHWWISWLPTAKSFWPILLPAVQQPRCLTSFTSGATAARNVLLGCHDGYVRQYSEAATTDDGTAIASWVKYGPFPLGSPGMDGLLTELSAVLDDGSGNVTWKAYAGDSPEFVSHYV